AVELLVATVLSAQTTDLRVNQVTPELFSRWPDPAALAAAEEAEVAEVVRPLGMGPTRARRLIALARGLLAEHDGEVPDDQAALEALPAWVARRPTWCAGRGSGTPCSRSTPTSGGSRAASAGPPGPIPAGSRRTWSPGWRPTAPEPRRSSSPCWGCA